LSTEMHSAQRFTPQSSFYERRGVTVIRARMIENGSGKRW